MSHRDYEAGWPWLREWYEIVSRMGVRLPDESAIHTYIVNEPPARIVESHFRLLAEFPGAPGTAWVTEFATSSPAQAQRMIDYYEADERITRYAWFTAAGWRPDMVLLDETRKVTPVGEVWSGAGNGPAAYP